jgi:hypothetical protein
MQLLPVVTRYYRVNYSRQELVKKLTERTFLSDKNFNAEKSKSYTFYGDISSADFYLENIQDKSQTTTILDGRILGVENEIFIKLTHRLWEKTTTPVLFIVTILLTSITFLHTWFNQYLWYASINHEPGYLTKQYSDKLYPENPLAFIVALAIGIMIYLYKKKLKHFQLQLESSKNYLQEFLEAKLVSKSQLPLVFR